MDVAITAVRSPAIVLGRPISASASARLSSTSRFSRELELGNRKCFSNLIHNTRYFVSELNFASLHFLSPSKVVEEFFVVRAASSLPESSESDVRAKIAPLQLESPTGQFLSQILVDHPHLVPAAMDQQLEQLQTDSDADQQKEEPSASGTDLILYRRIAEVKANERMCRSSLMLVQKFIDANIDLWPDEMRMVNM